MRFRRIADIKRAETYALSQGMVDALRRYKELSTCTQHHVFFRCLPESCIFYGNTVARLQKRKKGRIFIQPFDTVLVRPWRFERQAFGSGGQRSIQLSYGRTGCALICFVPPPVKVGAGCATHWLFRISAASRSMKHARAPDVHAPGSRQNGYNGVPRAWERTRSLYFFHDTRWCQQQRPTAVTSRTRKGFRRG